MINTILDIIRSLNGGCVIPSQEDKKTKINLYSDDVELYVDSFGEEKKYYYFADFKIEGEENDNLEQIESVLMNNEAFAIIGEPSPSDSYMILLWKVEKIDERIYPRIISIEENEFFYKKYIFYYTENELECFTTWYKKLDKNGKTLTDTLRSLQKLNDESEPVRFLTRLLTKVPFLNPVFPKAIMDDFDLMVRQRIDGIRQEQQRETIRSVNDIFIESTNERTPDIDRLSNVIYQKLMEE